MEDRRYQEAQPPFNERYRMHSGIEATHAQLKKLIPGSRVRVRGLKAVRFAVTLKAMGVNIQRAVHWLAEKEEKSGKKPVFRLRDLGHGGESPTLNRVFPALPPRR